jgi:hypothetical protein
VYRDPGGFYVYLVAVRLTVASLPYLTAGVSSFPGPIVGGVTRVRGVVSYEVPPVARPSRRFRCRGFLLLEAEELPPKRAAL